LRITIAFLFSLILLSCSSDLPVQEQFPDIKLIDQNGRDFSFSQVRGKVLVVAYIYTNCPDICHIISKKMNVFKERIKKSGLQDRVYFISITFDPERDTPDVLRRHAEMMNLDLDNWVFLTGDQNAVNATLSVAGMEAIKGPVDSSGTEEQSYSISHRDRISLADKKGRIRKNYKGSEFNPDELIEDIKRLL
jgi:protein SCO1/2